MPRKTRRPQQPALAMFPDHDDLPLFSGTPATAEEHPWSPKVRPQSAPQLDMFADEPAKTAPNATE